MSRGSRATVDRSTDPATKSADGSVLHRQGVTEIARPDADTAVPAVPLRRRDDAKPSRRDFTGTDVRPAKGNIRDDDADRAAATEWLIRELAPLLGLDPSKIDIRINAEAEGRANARGSDALMDGGRILLHPTRFHPHTREGRHLLAHEAVHLAQRQLSAAAPTVDDAEQEADRIARDFSEGRPIQKPHVALPPLAVAANNDTVADPIFDNNAAANRNRELAMIKRWLGGLWVSDGDVDDILILLASLPKATALALVRVGLKDHERYDLVNNINKHHFARFREQVLHVYQATPSEQLRKFDEDLLVNIPMSLLSNDEALAVDYVYQSLEPKAQAKLRNSKVGKAIGEIERYVSNPANMKQLDEDYRKSIEEETKEQGEIAENRAKLKKALADKETGPALAFNIKHLTWQIRRKLSQFWVKDADALEVLDLLAPHVDDGLTLQGIIDGLVDLEDPPKDDPGRYEEKKNYLDILLDEIPVERLYDSGSQRLRVLVRLMSFRPPYKNIALARKLINLTFSNSEDAFLAFHLVKALPDREQQAFIKAGGGKTWSDILSGLSASQREALGVNLYNGGKEQGDRNSILMQLMDDRVWANPPRLWGLVRMAIAIGSYAWVFAESERRIRDNERLLENDDFLRVVEKYRLYNPRHDATRRDGTLGPRTTFDPEGYKPAAFRGKKTSEEGPWAFVTDTIFGGIDFLAKSNIDVFASLFRKSIGGKGVNVAELQDLLGGDFFGLTFERQENLGIAGREALASGRGINFADDVQWDRGQGDLKLVAGELALASLHLQMPNTAAKLQAGRGSIRTLDVALHYPTKDNPTPSHIDVYAGEIELEDVLLILPTSMHGADEAAIGRLRVLSQTSGADPAREPAPRAGLLALGFGFFSNLFGVKASGKELAEKLVKPSTPMAVDVSIDSIKLRGVTSSGGQYVASITLKDFQLRGGGTAAAYRNALDLSKRRLETRIAREQKAAAGAPDPAPHDRVIAQLEKQLRRVTLELGEFAVLEALEARKQQHQKDSASASFTQDDEEKLAALNVKLAGVVMEIGSISAEGAEGLPASRFLAENIHGQGHNLSAILGSGFATQFLQGESTTEPARRGNANFSIDVGHVESSAIDVRGRIPTADEAQKDVEQFSKQIDLSAPGQAKKLDELNERVEVARKYEGLLRRGLENLDPQGRNELFSLRSRLEVFEAARAFHAGKIAVEGLTLEASETGTLKAQADAITADDIREGSTGASVERISGRGVSVSADVEGGVFGLREWRKNIKNGTLTAGQLDFTNIQHAGSGAVVRSLGLRGVTASAGRGGPVALKATGIDVGNVGVTVTSRLLLAERELLLSVPFPYFRDRDRKKVAAIDESLRQLSELDKRVASAAAALESARAAGKAGPIKKAEAALEAAEKARLAWPELLIVKGLSIQDLDIVVEGLGDILSEDFDFAAALRKGITVRGAGPGGRMISGATLTDSRLPGLAGKDVRLGPVGGSVTVSERGVQFKDFFIDSLVATALDYQGGDNRLWSKGTSTLTKLRVDASIENRETKDADGISQWVPSKITLTKLRIEKIKGDKLGFATKSFQIDLESGAVEKVTADDFAIELPEQEGGDVKTSGKAGVGGLHEARLHVLIGKTLSARGVLNGSDVQAEFFGDAKQTYHVQDLSIREGEITDPAKGSVKITVSHLSGDVAHRLTKTGDEYDLKNIRFDLLKLDKGSTWADAGTKLEILGNASFTNFRATANVKRKKVGDQFQIEQVTIPALSADQVEASDVHVAIAERQADPNKGIRAQPSKTASFKNATITKLRVEGFDLVKGLGAITTASANVADLAVQVAKKGEKAFKDTHLSIKGTGLTGTLKGPGKFAIDLGHIETLSGSYADNQTEVKSFSAKDLKGKVEIGPDYVHIFDLNSGPVTFGRTEYADAAGNAVTLDGVNAGAVHFVDLQANFAVDPKDKEQEQKLSSIVIKELKFDDIAAEGFTYVGSVTRLNKDKQTETSRSEVKAQKAVLKPLHIEDVSLDILKSTAHVKADIGQVSVNGFSGVFNTTVAGALVKSTKVASNVTGSHLRANLDFARVKLASGADWTRASGTFHLGSLGLSSPDVSVAEFAGGAEKSLLALTGPGGGIDLTGVDVTLAPNGTMHVKLEDVIARGLTITVKSPGKRFDIGLAAAQIKGASLSLENLGLDEGLKVLAAQTGKITAQGLKVDVHIDRKATASSSAVTGTPEKFVIEPLADAEGNLPFIVPYELVKGVNIALESLKLPVHKGSIDLDSVTLAGIIGDDPEELEKKKKEKKYSLSIDDGGILVTNPVLDFHLPDTKGRAGLYKDRGKRGTIVLEELVESYLNEPPDPKKTGVADLGFLDYLGFQRSDFQLGKGRVGTDSNFITLSDAEPGANLVKILDSVLGKNFELEVEKFRSSGAGFTVKENEGTPEEKKKTGKTGSMSFTNVKLKISGLGSTSAEFDITLRTDGGFIDGVTFGDVALLNETKLAEQEGPKVQEESK